MASDPFVSLLAAWNERDPAKMRALLDASLTADIEFVDPTVAITGIDAFAAMIRDFQGKYPRAQCVRTSGIDRHHDRARYAWSVIIDEKNRVDGFDAVALDAGGKRLRRIDGFFGPLPPA